MMWNNVGLRGHNESATNKLALGSPHIADPRRMSAAPKTPYQKRIDNKRQERLTRLLAVVAAAWVFFAGYYLLTHRLASAYVCTVPAVVASVLFCLSFNKQISRVMIANLNLAVCMSAVVIEAAISGQGNSDALFFLGCTSSLAAYQLGVRAATAWTVLALLAILTTNWWLPEMAQLRVPTNLDRLVTMLAVPLVIYGVSCQAERSSYDFAFEIFEEKEIAEELSQVSAELQERTRLLTLAEQVAHVGHWLWDIQSKSLTMSSSARHICGFSDEQEVSLEDFLGCIDAKGAEQLRASVESAAHQQVQFEVNTTLKRNGGVRYINCSGFSENQSDEAVAVFGVVKDETDATNAQDQLREKASELNQLAKYDPLTGLSNRLSFQRKLEEAVAQSERNKLEVALLLIDLDGFKEINDTMGHPCGDFVLKEVASRLRRVIRQGDDVARLGGDEFTIIVNEVTSDLDILLVAGRVRRAIGQPLTVEGKTVPLGASVGAAIFPRHAGHCDELLSFADTAMYVAKRQNSGVEIYNPEMTAEIVNRREIQDDLRTALANGEFKANYQPIVSSDKRIAGVEALLRWTNGEQEISPLEFVPHLEQTGEIVSVGKWILNEACQQASKWHDRQLPVSMSVNISPIQFRDPEFVDHVYEALQVSGLPGKFLDLESVSYTHLTLPTICSV